MTEKGQAILEMLLISVMVLVFWSGVSKTLRNQGVFQKIFGDPWTRLSNTMEFGVPAERSGMASVHPAEPARHSTRVKR